MAKILILSSSDLYKDPRVLRQINTLIKNHEITACGLSPSRIKEVNELPILFRPSKMQSLFKRGLTFLRMLFCKYDRLTWDSSVFKQLANKQFDLIIVNDPREMSLAVKLKKHQFVAPKIYFDLHEYFINVDDNKIINRMFKSLTDQYQGEADVLTTVSNEIAELYSKRYSRDVQIITNAGRYHEYSPKAIGQEVRIVHHGILNRARKIEEMIALMKFADNRFTLDFYLLGTDQAYLKELKKMAEFSNKIKFRKPVAFNEIVPMLKDYDIGLFILSDEVESYKLALPNKFFEFIQARLAIAISPNVAMKTLVEKYSNGVVGIDFKGDSLAQKLNSLSNTDIFQMKLNSNIAAKELNDEVSSERLVKIVDKLISDI